MAEKVQTTGANKTSLCLLFAVLVAVLLLSLARGHVVSSIINEAYATGPAGGCPPAHEPTSAHAQVLLP